MILVRFLSYRTDQMPQHQLESARRTFLLWVLSLVGDHFLPLPYKSFTPHDSRVLVVRIEDSSCEIKCVSGHLPFSQPPTTLVTIMSRVPTLLVSYLTVCRAGCFFEQTEHRGPGGQKKYFRNVRVESSSLWCVTLKLSPRLRRKCRNGRCQKNFCCC